MSTTARCSKCGAPVSDVVARGFCPACMLEEGLTLVDPKKAPITTKHFGDYELIEEVARGGMGVVFKARQRSLNRVVAVKMILSGHLASEAEAKRFRAEARAAAALQHPGIVAIHEVGEHEGLLFFSMDYIDGKNLAEIVRDGPFSAMRAAECLRDIAEAIHYAHEHGVLHRDLKPSNVLIDASDKPRVTDFGLAKQLNPGSQPSIQGPQLTLSGQLLGSPNFMPPEQAAGKHRELTPASEVYSLGALLYHLLTGRPPFLAENIPATLRLVTETEPVAPRHLAPGLPRDLETICLKCLEKDPQRRYTTAKELGDELQRFLNHEPIHARPITAPLKLWRWCRRKPALASALAACALVLATGIAGVTWQWRRAETNAINAQRLRMSAEQSSAKSSQVAQFLKDMLGAVSPSVALGRDTKLMKEILDKAASRVGKDLTNQPIVEAELRDTLSGAYLTIGDSAKAVELARGAVEIWKKPPQNGIPRSEYAAALNRLAQALRGERDTESEAVTLEALEIGKKLRKETHEMAVSLNDLGRLRETQGKLPEAEQIYRQSYAILTNRWGPEAHHAVGLMANLARTLRKMGRTAEATALYRDSLAMMERSLPEEHPDLSNVRNSLALLFNEQRRFGEAEDLMRRVLAADEKVFGPEHQETAIATDNLAVALGRQGKHAEAEALHRRSLALLQKSVRPDDPGLATSFEHLGRILEKQAKWSEAERPYRDALAVARTRATNDPNMFEKRLCDLGDNLYRQKRFGDAEPFYRECLQSRRTGFRSDQEPVLQAKASLARLLVDWVLAEPTNSVAAKSNAVEVKVRSPLERANEAEKLLRQCLAVRSGGTNATHWRTGDVKSRLGSAVLATALADLQLTAEARQLRLEEAEKLLLEGYEQMQQSRSADSSSKRDAVQRLVCLHEYWDSIAPATGQSIKAAEWKIKLGSTAN